MCREPTNPVITDLVRNTHCQCFISGLYLAQTYWGTNQAWATRLTISFNPRKKRRQLLVLVSNETNEKKIYTGTQISC